MKVYSSELKAYELYLQEHKMLPELSTDQMNQISEIKIQSELWLREHQFVHHIINLLLLIFLFFLDISSCSILPIHFQHYFYFFAVLHGYLIYSISTFTLNEGAAHHILFQGNQLLSFLGVNLSRLYFADPIYFAENHTRHHQFFASKNDGVFTSLVHPKRFILSLMPLASAFKFCDYKIHTGDKWTRSKITSEILGRIFFIGQFFYLRNYVGGGKAFLFIFIALWFAFILDRLRETVEHNLMGDKITNGVRNFGLGYWGLLIGGGPWGMPCRLSHHLAPQSTWYQQIALHWKLKSILTIEQKRFFFIRNFPLLLLKTIKLNSSYIKRVA